MTSTGYKTSTGNDWYPTLEDNKPAIAICEHPGDMLTPPMYTIIATFQNQADRDLVIHLKEQYNKTNQPKEQPKNYGTNAGITCDTDSGPCACGAWH